MINKWKYKMPCTKFKSNGTIIDDGIDIANKLNNFFVNVGNTLAKSIPTSHKHPNNYISYNASNTFSLEPVTENEICKIIGTFKDSVAGWVGIKPGIVKHIKEIVCIPLKHICDMSFQSGIGSNNGLLPNKFPTTTWTNCWLNYQGFSRDFVIQSKCWALCRGLNELKTSCCHCCSLWLYTKHE